MADRTDAADESGAPAERAGASAERGHRALSAPVLTLDLGQEAGKLRQETPWLQHGKNAVTLAKYPDFRIVFLLLKPGSRLKDHRANGRVSVQTMSGHARLHLAERTVDLPAGHLVVLDRDVAHDVEGIEESAILLTIAWAGEAAAP